MLWNQLKSNALGIPVKVLEEADTTVLGGVFVRMVGRRRNGQR